MDDNQLLYPKVISYIPRKYTNPTLDSPNDVDRQDVTTDRIITTLITMFPWLTDPCCHNLLLAGGSLATIIQSLSINNIPTIKDLNDLDFFMIGCQPDPNPPNPINGLESRRWDTIIPSVVSETCRSKLETIITKLKTEYPNCSLIRTPYAITLTDGIHKFQIILASYTTPNEVLTSFDLGASKSGIYFTAEGPRFITNELGLYSLEHRVNSIRPDKHSALYVSRLTKYLHRGYAIEFPYLYQNNPSTKKLFKPRAQIKFPYMTIQLDDIHNHHMLGTIVTTEFTGNVSVGYDGNLDYKLVDSSIALFIKNNKFLMAKVHASQFQTGAEAIAKSLIIHEITPLEVIYYLPPIYNDGKLDITICSTLKDFDYNEFLKCYQNSDLLNSYLTAVYYYPKAVEYTKKYHEAYVAFCEFKIILYDRKLFGGESKSYVEWYGKYS